MALVALDRLSPLNIILIKSFSYLINYGFITIHGDKELFEATYFVLSKKCFIQFTPIKIRNRLPQPHIVFSFYVIINIIWTIFSTQ